MLKNLKIIAVIIIAVFFNGCNSYQVNFTKDMSTSINSIEIVQDINKPKLPFLHSRKDGFLFRVIGVFGDSMINNDMKEEKKLALYLQEHNIDITTIYKKALNQYIQNSSFENKIVSKDGEYKLKSIINNYGLIYNKKSLYNDYKPVIELTLQLIDKNNKVVFSKSEIISSYNTQTLEASYSKLFNDPKTMERVLKSGVEEIIKIFLDDLQKEI